MYTNLRSDYQPLRIMKDQLNPTFIKTYNITPFELNKIKDSYAEDGHLEDYDLGQALFDIRDGMRKSYERDADADMQNDETAHYVSPITQQSRKRLCDKAHAEHNYSRIARLAARESKETCAQSQPSRSEIKYPRRTARKKRSSDCAQSKHKRQRRECSKSRGR